MIKLSGDRFEEVTDIGFRFEGGIANSGQLNFYEAGRYRYAAARFLYTIEHFRKTGAVIERLNKPIDADFRISAPSVGSFLELVQLYGTPVVQDAQQFTTYFNIPFSKMLPWVLDKVLPKATSNDRIFDIAEKQINIINSGVVALQDANKEREITERLRIEHETERQRLQHETDHLRIQKDIQMLDLIRSEARREGDGLRENLKAATELGAIVKGYALKDSVLRNRESDPDEDPQFISKEIVSETNRAQLVADYQEKFDEITNDDEQKIVDRIRKTMPDMGFPLKRSSSQFSIEVSNDNTSIATINEGRLRQMIAVSRDDNAVRLIGGIVRLDKDHGFGRFRPAGSRSSLSFTIPREIYYPNKSAFVSAFGANEIMVEALPFRDGIGNIIKLLLLRVV
jgi:hypothetical protein